MSFLCVVISHWQLYNGRSSHVHWPALILIDWRCRWEKKFKYFRSRLRFFLKTHVHVLIFCNISNNYERAINSSLFKHSHDSVSLIDLHLTSGRCSTRNYKNFSSHICARELTNFDRDRFHSFRKVKSQSHVFLTFQLFLTAKPVYVLAVF